MAVVTLSNFKPFAEWSKLGYKINKGSRATWVDDVAMFAEQQVSKTPPRSTSRVDYGNQWKDCAPKGTSPHWMQGDYEDDDSPDAYGFFYN